MTIPWETFTMLKRKHTFIGEINKLYTGQQSKMHKVGPESNRQWGQNTQTHLETIPLEPWLCCTRCFHVAPSTSTHTSMHKLKYVPHPTNHCIQPPQSPSLTTFPYSLTPTRMRAYKHTPMPPNDLHKHIPADLDLPPACVKAP